MKKLLLDPAFFNYVLMALYIMATVRWCAAKKFGDALYWFCALLMTVVLTWFKK